MDPARMSKPSCNRYGKPLVYRHATTHIQSLSHALSGSLYINFDDSAFLDRYGGITSAFCPRGSWDFALIEEITDSFLTQVQGLMETVKQMDR